jgi:hypothetical protein
MRRRVKLWSAGLLVLVSMSRGGEPATLLQQQPLPHHPIHDPTWTHPELIEVTETRTTDFGVSKTIIRLSPMLVAPVIDGAKTPGRIPDEVAFRTLLGTIALPAAPSAKEQARVNSKLQLLGLDAHDQQVLTQELRLYYTASAERKQRMDSIRQSVGINYGQTTWTALVQEDQALSRLAVDTYSRLLTALSPAGALRLQEHVAQIKTKIKITPPPNMSH